MVQYIFEGPEMNVSAKPHGNSKDSQPFFRTTHSTQQQIKQLSESCAPKKVVEKVTTEKGGDIEVRSAAFLPHDKQQVKIFRRGFAKDHDNKVLYSLMMDCKLSQGKNEIFVHDVKAAPEPQSVLFFDWQLADMVRSCTNNHSFSILSFDITLLHPQPTTICCLKIYILVNHHS